MSIREGRWRCTHCQKENLGRHMKCVGQNSDGCGNDRDVNVTFYLPENSPVVTDLLLLELARKRPSQSVKQKPTTEKATSRSPRAFLAADVIGEEEKVVLAKQPHSSPPLRIFGRDPVDLNRIKNEEKKGLHRKFKIGVLGFAIAALLAFVVWRMFFATFSVEAHVVSFSWKRSVSIELYQTVREQGWSVPLAGRQISSEWKIRTYQQVLDHYETRTRQVSETVQTGTESYSCGTRDLGNGFFEDQSCSRPTYGTRYHTESYQDPVYRQEPIYDTYYIYDIEKWLHDRIERSNGENQKPVWPLYTLKGDVERVSGRAENYVVNFKTIEGEIIERKYPEVDWMKMKMGQGFRIDRNRIGVIQSIELL